jgi:hypothetical protein
MIQKNCLAAKVDLFVVEPYYNISKVRFKYDFIVTKGGVKMKNDYWEEQNWEQLQEKLGTWIRGEYEIEKRNKIGSIIIPKRGLFEEYNVLITDPREYEGGAAEVESQLIDLLNLTGKGKNADKDMVELYEHYLDCGKCKRCNNLEKRVLDFVNRWGKLGLSKLNFIGNKVIKDYWDKGAFKFTENLMMPEHLKPEPVELFLYAATLLREWWEQYKDNIEKNNQESIESDLVDQLMWGVMPETRKYIEKFVSTAIRSSPDTLPKKISDKVFAEKVADLRIKYGVIFIFEMNMRLSNVFSDNNDSLQGYLNELKNNIKHLNEKMKNELKNKSIEEIQEISLKHIQNNPILAEIYLRIFNEMMLTLPRIPQISNNEAIFKSYLNAPIMGVKNPEEIFNLIRTRKPYLHQGLNQVLLDINLTTELNFSSKLISSYNFPTLWHAIHMQLHLILVRGDSILVRCDYCEGPLLRFPKRERGYPRKYCSEACRRAAQRE